MISSNPDTDPDLNPEPDLVTNPEPKADHDHSHEIHTLGPMARTGASGGDGLSTGVSGLSGAGGGRGGEPSVAADGFGGGVTCTTASRSHHM